MSRSQRFCSSCLQPEFKDGASYVARYESALFRALNLIRSHVNAKLTDAFDEVFPHVSSGGSFFGGGAPGARVEIRPLTLDEAFPYLYARYRAGAPETRGLVREIEARTDDFPSAVSILNDVQGHYFSLRRKLLFPVFQHQTRDVVAEHEQ